MLFTVSDMEVKAMDAARNKSFDYLLPGEDINLARFNLEDEAFGGDFDENFFRELDSLTDDEWDEAFGNGVIIP